MTGALADDDVEIEIEGAQETAHGAARGVAAIGRVTAAGARAAALVDRRVLVGPIDPCGECEICRRGGAAVCPRARRREAAGAAAGDPPRRLVAAARWLVPLEGGLELAAPAGAAAAGDAAVAYTLYARTGIGPREPTVVVGASPIARFLVEILRAKGAAPVVVVDPAHAAWAAWLAGRGAAVARAGADADDDEVRAAVAAELAAHGAGARPWRVLAATREAVPRAAALAGPRATLTLLAPVPDLPGDLVAREVTVIGVVGAHPDLVVEVAAMCQKGEIDLVDGTAAAPDDVMRAVVRRP
ncbi:MAG TPA: alcohol dehydrogenase catalytic domain-containing protein [Kofleriaceae bacterium]|nr:alcohol dehydrogenase catalytic domain-containing protein [Kofleriaceae bacterium]